MNKDLDLDRERLRQQMDDLLRDARALRALIEEASHSESQKGDRRTPGAADPAPHPRGHRHDGR